MAHRAIPVAARWHTGTGLVSRWHTGTERSVLARWHTVVNGRDLLAIGSDDRTVRVWDLQTGACVLTPPVYHLALAVAWVAEALAVGLDTGILVINQGGAGLAGTA